MMVSSKNLNNTALDSTEHACPPHYPMRDAFNKWLSCGNSTIYSPQVSLTCLDRISEYVVDNNISCSIWDITKINVYKPIYQIILDTKSLRIKRQHTYKIFTVVGQQYLMFLLKKPWEEEADYFLKNSTLIEQNNDNDVPMAIDAKINIAVSPVASNISTEKVSAWLITQPNSYGTLYRKNVIRSYMSALRNAPQELTLDDSVDRNVFACHTIDELDKLWQVFKTAPDYVVINRTHWHGQLSAGLAVLRRYLEHLEIDNADENYVIAQYKQPEFENASEMKGIVNSLRVDFNHPVLYSKTHPVSCTINRQPVIPKKMNWVQMLIAITEKLIHDNAPNLNTLDKVSLYGNQVFFLPSKSLWYARALLSNGKWITTNFSPQTIVAIIGNLCRHCEIDLDTVDISFIRDSSYPAEIREKAALCELPVIDDAVSSTLTEIIEQKFPNGIRPNSIIDTNKLHNYFFDIMGKGIHDDIPDIPSALEAVGIKHGDKVFVVSESDRLKLEELFTRLLSNNNRMFFYDELYGVHADFFEGLHIFSSELLRTILSEVFPSVIYFKKYCQTDRSISVESEILRCFESLVALSYDQLKDKLPYIPLPKIRQVLAQSGKFVWVKKSVYTHLQGIVFDTQECEDICKNITKAIDVHGFASLATENMLVSAELNPELSETAIRNGFYQVYLAKDYEKRGNIVSEKGTVLNAVAVFQDFCRSHERLSLKELIAYEKEIIGSVHNQSLYAAYDNMVRVDYDTFVADSVIQFDVEKTDIALSRFVAGEVIPLGSVTSFTSFPFIDGYSWNLFLLESYCRRFSRKYHFQCLSVSSSNVGAIYKKSVGFTNYATVVAAAVGIAQIKLDEQIVGDFLSESGFIARRTSFVAEVVELARLLKDKEIID